jgi:hypothetical protein
MNIPYKGCMLYNLFVEPYSAESRNAMKNMAKCGAVETERKLYW